MCQCVSKDRLKQNLWPCGWFQGPKAGTGPIRYYSLGLGQKARLGEPLESKGKTEGKKHSKQDIGLQRDRPRGESV